MKTNSGAIVDELIALAAKGEGLSHDDEARYNELAPEVAKLGEGARRVVAPLTAVLGGRHLTPAAAQVLEAIDPSSVVSALLSDIAKAKPAARASAAEKLRALVRALEEFDGQRRSRVARELFERGLPVLREAAAAGDVGVRGPVLGLLGLLGPSGEETLALLVAALRERQDASRESVVGPIRAWKEAAAPAVPALIDLIGGPVRIGGTYTQACDTLAAIGAPAVAAIPALERLRETIAPVLEEFVAAALKALRVYAPAAPVVRPTSGDPKADALVAELAELCEKTQTESLSDAEKKRFEKLAKEARELGPKARGAVPQLMDVLKCSSGPLISTAAMALEEIDPEGVVSSLAAKLSDPVPSNRIRAAQQLQRMLTYLEGTKVVRRSRIANVLADTALDALRAAAGAPEPRVRESTLYVLGRLGPSGDETLAVLRRGLKDKGERVAYWTAVGLSSWGPAAAPAVPELRRLLSTESDDAAASALAAIGPAAAAAKPDLARKAGLRDSPGRFSAADALAKLVKQAEKPSRARKARASKASKAKKATKAKKKKS
jgi:hypothetical protein